MRALLGTAYHLIGVIVHSEFLRLGNPVLGIYSSAVIYSGIAENFRLFRLYCKETELLGWDYLQVTAIISVEFCGEALHLLLSTRDTIC